MSRKTVQLGCEVLVEEKPDWFGKARLGLLANQASTDSRFRATGSLIIRHGGNLACLFSPQHGFFSEKQANMRESDDGWEASLNLPVYSLYGELREPSPEVLKKIDVLIVDLPDVGTRVYTYATTMGLCLEAAARQGIKVVVLDRPNPINGALIEGNTVDEDHRSFVGRYPLPMRHGLTMGELARFIVKRCHVPCDLQVIAMRGWSRGDWFSDLRLPWLFPSPNVPTWETALFYPGMVLLEGTNISEGRGTTLPFQVFGAPFLDQRRLLNHLDKDCLGGVVLRPICFEPVFDKWAGQLCNGFQIHVTDRAIFRPYRFGLALIQALRQTHEGLFQWLPPPYEYEWEKLPIDILLGRGGLRQGLEQGKNIHSLEAAWADDLDRYRQDRADCLLYQ